MYAIIPQQIPQGKRAEINEKILFAINSGKDMIPAESIYNCYTGIGGLHNLKQSDFASYHEYAEAKKEFEMGQFFTPHEVCRDMVDVLPYTLYYGFLSLSRNKVSSSSTSSILGRADFRFSGTALLN